MEVIGLGRPSCCVATHHDTLSMTTPVPVGIRDFDIFILELLLLPHPLLAQVFTFLPLRFLSFSIRQERGVDGGVLSKLRPLYRVPVFVYSAAGCGRVRVGVIRRGFLFLPFVV